MGPRKPPEFASHPVKFGQATEAGLVRAVCCHVSDGDTADFLMDLGWYQYAYIPMRFRGINTEELRGTTGAKRKKAIAAKNKVAELIMNKPVLLKSYKQKTTFERFVGDVYIDLEFPGIESFITLGSKDWISICDILLKLNLAEKLDMDKN